MRIAMEMAAALALSGRSPQQSALHENGGIAIA
jgi:hypothetical protein